MGGGGGVYARFENFVDGVRCGVVATALAAIDRRTPVVAKVVVVAATAYYFAPFDIADNDHLAGWFDEVFALPVALFLAALMTPLALRREFLDQASTVGPSTDDVIYGLSVILLVVIEYCLMIWDLLSDSR